jgi:Fic family protein
LVLEFHRIITEGTYDERCIECGEKPGEYKHHHYVIGINETGAAPDTVSEEIIELLEDLGATDIKPKDVLAAGAYFHAKFEDIHPFADGNGRTGRILLNYFLITHNHPPVTIYDEDRTAYYAALEAFHSMQDIKPLTEFIEQQTVKTWEKTLERSRTRRPKDRAR